MSSRLTSLLILGDPGADKWGEGKFKRAEKIYMERRKVKNGGDRLELVW